MTDITVTCAICEGLLWLSESLEVSDYDDAVICTDCRSLLAALGPLPPPGPPSGADYCPITKITCLNTQCLSSKKCAGGGGDLEEKCPSCGTIGWPGLCDCEDEWEDEETDDDDNDDDD